MRKRTPLPPRGSTKQSSSPSFRLPALDSEFLLGDTMRGVRFLLEYAKAEETLRASRIRSTIVVFGSARIGEKHRWYAVARAFGRIASQRGGALNGGKDGHDNVIATGGGPGAMEAANRGASEAGALSIGFNIRLPKEQTPNRYSTPGLTFQFHYFAMRKMHLAMRANGLVVFPGGFGTLDELFEILTLRQTGKVNGLPVVLVDQDYWTRVINFKSLIDHNMIERKDLELFSFANDAEQIWQNLADGGLKIRSNAAKGRRSSGAPKQPI